MIFGIRNEENGIPVKRFCGNLNTLLGTTISDCEINNIYKIGKSDKSPIEVQFIPYQSKTTVLENYKELKGTNISIVPDLTKIEQERNEIFRNHLKDIRNTTQDRCHIKGEKLYRNNQIFTVEDLLEIEERKEQSFFARQSSEPQTPSKSYAEPQTTRTNRKRHKQKIK
ncbi:hypothetical protein JTB14_002929 [Gonioctena quinquepunctata]|nr:hypothetical protein JTB14_002929 [Gonioctena quinquepunctata]